MNIDDLTIGEVREVQSLLTKNNNNRIYDSVIGQICVIRTYSAGVHIGTVKQVAETTVLLKDSRRLWSWQGAFTLSEVAQNGITGGRIACCNPILLLPQFIEIIPVTEKAIATYVKYYESD